MSAMPPADRYTIVAAPVAETPTLSKLEWKVVALALDEAFRGRAIGARGPGAIGRFLSGLGRALFGIEGVPPLADPRLETLRRFVNSSRRGHRDAVALAKRLVEQGFSAGQVRAVEMLVGR